jgi:ABC-type sugar transport system permease subunit
MFKDIQFLNASKNSAIFAVSGIFFLLIPAIFISWALTQKIRAKAFFRYIVVVPLLLPVVVVALLWKMLYNPVFGPINNLLEAIGLGFLAIPWLGDTRTALLAIVVATAWRQLGMWVLLLSAGLERIPQELLEAARIDGATEWQVFHKVTLPLVWGVLRLLFILWSIVSLQVFAEVWIMTPHGGIARSTDVLGTLIYDKAFGSKQWGVACAMATFLMIVIFIISIIMNKVTKRETIEY